MKRDKLKSKPFRLLLCPGAEVSPRKERLRLRRGEILIPLVILIGFGGSQCDLPVGAWQVGGNNRVIISTIVGGGSTATIPALQAPMTNPTATAIDPLGRGIFVVDERDNSSLLRFVNTTAPPVEISETMIDPGYIYRVAGGGTGGDGNPLEEV